MDKGIEAAKNKESAIFEDSIIAGVLHAKGHSVKPLKQSNNKVVFYVAGDIEKSIKEIYDNCQIGALDIMRSIKLIRSMVFYLRYGGQK